MLVETGQEVEGAPGGGCKGGGSLQSAPGWRGGLSIQPSPVTGPGEPGQSVYPHVMSPGDRDA